MVKFKKIKGLTAAGLFHAGWKFFSEFQKNKPIPGEKTVLNAKNRYLREMGIEIDTGVIEEERLLANGFNLHMILLPQNKKAPTIVFVHGTSCNAWFYIEFLYKLYEEGFNVVAFDMRGHGTSGGPRGDYTISEGVDDTLAVVRYAEKRFGGPVAVAGSSQGGIIAFYAAARDKSLAAAVCHNVADLNGRDNLILSRLKLPWQAVPLIRLVMRMYKGLCVPVSLYLDLNKEFLKNGVTAYTYAKTEPTAINWVTLRVLESLLYTQLPCAVEDINVPVMLIHAGEDNIFPRDYVEGIFNRLNCKKKYMLMEGREHLVVTNYPEELAPSIADWLMNEV